MQSIDFEATTESATDVKGSGTKNDPPRKGCALWDIRRLRTVMKFLFFYIPLTALLEWFLIHMGILPYHYGLAFQTVCMILCVPLWALANRLRK